MSDALRELIRDNLLLSIVLAVAVLIAIILAWRPTRKKPAAPQQAPTPRPAPAAAPTPAPQPVQAAAASLQPTLTPEPSTPAQQDMETLRKSKDYAKFLSTLSLTNLIAELGLSNVIKADDEIGMKFDHVLIAALYVFTLVAVLFPGGAKIVSLVSTSSAAGFLGGLILFILAFSGTVGYFFVYVREDVGLITVNAAKGTQHVLKTGINAKNPLDRVYSRNFIDLTQAKITVTHTYNTKDGARYDYTANIFYRPSVVRLPIYRAVKEADLVSEVETIVRSILSRLILEKTSAELGTSTGTMELEMELHDRLGQNDDAGHVLEYRFGIDLVDVTLSEATPDERIINANTLLVVSKKFSKAIEEIKEGHPDMTSAEAANYAAMIDKQPVTKVVHGFEATQIVAGLERALTNVGGNVVEALKNRGAQHG